MQSRLNWLSLNNEIIDPESINHRKLNTLVLVLQITNSFLVFLMIVDILYSIDLLERRFHRPGVADSVYKAPNSS